jgi:mannose-6-phosphate isomerase-like protein (cupin superfamily)
MTAINTHDISADWKARGFSCDVWIDPPGQRWEDFVHHVDELVLVVEGMLELEISGVTSQPEPGEEVFIPAGAIHSVRNIGNTTARWIYGYGKKESPDE